MGLSVEDVQLMNMLCNEYRNWFKSTIKRAKREEKACEDHIEKCENPDCGTPEYLAELQDEISSTEEEYMDTIMLKRKLVTFLKAIGEDV
jgi:uncharacterized protein YbaP (TraB family)